MWDNRPYVIASTSNDLARDFRSGIIVATKRKEENFEYNYRYVTYGTHGNKSCDLIGS